ncbi:c-type cytochrome [Gymnodinialimonas phycosphaerae]|uniref:c-type cytochrome n=1 Tax=Gymnodinialimonas phycosphaerae TaxID=2841589 RepID=UPI0031F455DC
MANGELVFNAAGCGSCHAIDGDDRILAGGMDFLIGRVGTLYAPNITAHPTAGIGNWSRADFLNAVLRGVSPEGETYLGAAFPLPAYARMNPEDAVDLQAYLTTLPQSDAPSRDHAVNFLGDAYLSLFSRDQPGLMGHADPQLERG